MRMFSASSCRALLALALLVPILLAGCSRKAGIKSPEQPAHHWLDEAPGVPVENKSKLEAAIPNLYAPDKKFSFEECVYLTIQQSPLLVNSAVDLEIKRVDATDAVWQTLPEPHMLLTVSSNITRYNESERDVPSDYGQTRLNVSFYASIPNPIKSYYNIKAKKALVNVALSTHRKAVGEIIYKIAQAYLKLHAQREILAAKKGVLPLGKELVAYWQQVENVEGKQGASRNLATQHQRELELTVEQGQMEEVMQHTQLKILAGVEPQQKFSIDTTNVDKILEGFDGRKLKWEDCWSTTEDDLLLRGQIKLSDNDIILAWAEYVPSMSLHLNNSPPSGQYQPARGREDWFAHLSFDFPLLDWGRRYRGVQTARMKKAQAFHEMAQKRTDYGNRWLQAEQQVALAETQFKLEQTRFDTAKMRYEEAKIAFEQGTEEQPLVTQRHEEMANANIALIQARLSLQLAQLDWMYLANRLQERILGRPAREVI